MEERAVGPFRRSERHCDEMRHGTFPVRGRGKVSGSLKSLARRSSSYFTSSLGCYRPNIPVISAQAHRALTLGRDSRTRKNSAILGRREEQGVIGGAGSVDAHPLGQSGDPLFQQKMMVGWGDVNAPVLEGSPS